MSSYNDLIRKVSCNFNDEIKRASSAVFECLNLNYFYYHKITDSGHLTLLGSDPAWVEYFGAQKFYVSNPFHRNSNSFRNCFVVLKNVVSNDFNQIMVEGRERFNFHFNLQIMNRTVDGVETFGFSSPTSDDLQIAMLINELPLINLFINKFRLENRRIFSKLDDNKVDLAKLVGPDFHVETLPAIPKCCGRQVFLRKMGIECGELLSPREVEVMKLLLLGYSAGKIAPQIYLSKRTVEHHIERIKQKLGCESRAELIQKARELEAFGYFRSGVLGRL